jgi:hypothetical protein
MNSIELNLDSLAQFLITNKSSDLNSWQDIVSIHNSRLGGCNCNRASREINAHNYFVAKINNEKKHNFEKLKNALKVDKILFKSSDGNILLEV